MFYEGGPFAGSRNFSYRTRRHRRSTQPVFRSGRDRQKSLAPCRVISRTRKHSSDDFVLLNPDDGQGTHSKRASSVPSKRRARNRNLGGSVFLERHTLLVQHYSGAPGVGASLGVVEFGIHRLVSQIVCFASSFVCFTCRARNKLCLWLPRTRRGVARLWRSP